MKLLVLLTATLLASANARSLRLPEARFASLEGFAEDMYDTEAIRPPRHAADFAEFDRPLSADAEGSSSHHRFARGAVEPSCDCADNPDLVGEIVETAPVDTAPVEEAPFCAILPPQPAQHQQVVYELVEAPEERAGVELTADDAQFEDDQEATLCDEGLHPENEADIEPCAGRPARQLGGAPASVLQDEANREAEAVPASQKVLEVKPDEEVAAKASSEEETDVSSEEVERKASEGKAVSSEAVKSEAIKVVKAEASERVKSEASAAVKTEDSDAVKAVVSEGANSKDNKDAVIGAAQGSKAGAEGVPEDASDNVNPEIDVPDVESKDDAVVKPDEKGY